MIFESKLIRAVVILITALAGWSFGRSFNSTILVAGGSMEPTLRSGQMLSCNRSVPAHIPRGTIVVVSRFLRPLCIKRVVGLPNESVTFDRGEVFIDGAMLREPYLPDQVTTFSWDRDHFTTGEDGYMVLGDNRGASSDSRDYGVISRAEIVGIVELRFPTPELLGKPNYRIKIHARAAAREDCSPGKLTGR